MNKTTEPESNQKVIKNDANKKTKDPKHESKTILNEKIISDLK